MVAAVSMTDDHMVAIYNVQKGVDYRRDPMNKDTGLVALGKVTKNDVFDIKFVPVDYSILLACMKEVNMLTWREGKVLSERCIWNEQKP